MAHIHSSMRTHLVVWGHRLASRTTARCALLRMRTRV
jgi:hypothetical protein